MSGIFGRAGGQLPVLRYLRKFTSSVAGQTYQFARQFYGDEFYWGMGKRRNYEKKDAHRKG